MNQRFESDPVVVLGFGAAAVGAICALRASGYDGAVTVVTDADPDPYSPVLTSYYAGGRIDRGQCFPWADLDVPAMVDDLVAHAEITALDVVAHEVALADGCRIPYSKLLVATGAHPVAPGFPELASPAPHMLRTMHDAERLRLALANGKGKRVLVAGTSMVGLKAVEACLDKQANVTMLGRSGHILRASAHPLIAGLFEQLLAERGVALRLSQSAVRVEEGDGGCTVHFNNGDAERFDEVILAQGVKPNLGFVDAKAACMDEGLVVDSFMRTSAPDVFAAGDVAQALDLSSGKKRIIGLWQNAVQQGRCAGRAIAAELAGHAPSHPHPGAIPSNTIHVRDIVFASAGSVAERDGVRIEERHDQSATVLFAFEEREGAEQLAGFNLLAVDSSAHGRNALLDEIGMYRRKVLNSYL